MTEPVVPIAPFAPLTPLNPLCLPLHGSRLIEASAGTGKTWTIAALYLRLVLGHGREQPLLPGQILVMSFTQAATRELSERIRQRLVQAAECFRGNQLPSAEDAYLRQLLAAHAEPREVAAWRLALAAQAMDEAAVFTIDAWCQRMLREHAFDSGSALDEELLAQEAPLRSQALHDYWRAQVYPLTGYELATALALWPDVQRLAQAMKNLIDQPLDTPAAPGSLQACMAAALAQQQAALAQAKQGWMEQATAMSAWLEAAFARPGGNPFNGSKLKPDTFLSLLAEIWSWASDPSSLRFSVSKAQRTRLTPAGLIDAFKKGMRIAIAPMFEAWAPLMQAVDELPDPAAQLQAHAATHISARLAQLKAQARRFGHADVLNRLDTALDVAQRGARARALRRRILDQYPVALIDEFQDTSPVQLRVFDRLYRIAQGDAAQALLLIGDPKQAIYGFRGADIYSYLQARAATAGRHHVLGTSYRSTQALVGVVNTWFGQAEQRPGPGAFLLRASAAPATLDLPFVPLQALGRATRLVASAGPLPALCLELDASLRSQGHSRALFAALCAERIAALLNDEQAGFMPDPNAPSTAAGGASPAPFQRLRCADIAVLVRKGSEARAVRQALQRRGIASVYLSDRDSVFASAEASDLLRLMQAVAAPRDLRLLRAALATALLGLSLAELLHLATQDEALDEQAQRAARLHGVWRSQGVLAMLRRLLHEFALPSRWLATPDGQRRLTNLLHLAELLQEESARHDGQTAVLHWLAEQIAEAQQSDAPAAGDEQVLRLESDAGLVKVATIYKSKGLEYPLVFLPFAAHFRAVTARSERFVRLPGVVLPQAAAQPAASGHGADEGDDRDDRDGDGDGDSALALRPGQPLWVLAPSSAHIEQAERERLREDMRLLYVALTRAQQHVWLGAAALSVGNAQACRWHSSALGQLISGPAERQVDELVQDVYALAEQVNRAAALDAPGAAPAMQVQPVAHDVKDAQSIPVTPWRGHSQEPALGPPRAYAAPIDRGWSIASYSGLVRHLQGAVLIGLRPGSAEEVLPADLPDLSSFSLPNLNPQWRDDENVSTLAGDPPAAGAPLAARPIRAAASSAAAWHRFPRGALAGNFLHTQLQWLADEGFALAASPSLQRALLQRCEREGWGRHGADVLAWLLRLCSQRLPALGAALAGLDRCLPEMEFWLPMAGCNARELDQLCRRHILSGQPRPALPERALRGLMTGFADLVYQHDGRYGVLDYKSNALGERDAHYTPQALQAAMLEHRYDVQAALYLLALHRLLRQRLGAAYVPAQHLHGAVYLFMRGINSPTGGAWHLTPPLALIDALDALLGSLPANDVRAPA